MSFSKNELVEYRMTRAKEAFSDGEILASRERWNAAANRLYYACFYAVTAYLAYTDMVATTHAGVKSAFNKELILTGKLTKEDGKLYNVLFSLRQEADYEDFNTVEQEEVQPLVSSVYDFLSNIEGIISTER
jgi:uncharacterized protein (UPF0332 family)